MLRSALRQQHLLLQVGTRTCLLNTKQLMGYNIMRTNELRQLSTVDINERGERGIVQTRVEMKSYATYDLPSNVIELSNKIIPCHVGVCSRAIIRANLHPSGRLRSYGRWLYRSQIRFCPQGSCIVKAHSTRRPRHVSSCWSCRHPIVRIFCCLLMLPVLGLVIDHPRTRVGLVFEGQMVKSLGLALCMHMVRLRYWLGCRMLLVMMMVVAAVVIFIWLPRNLLVGLDRRCGEWQGICVRRGGELCGVV